MQKHIKQQLAGLLETLRYSGRSLRIPVSQKMAAQVLRECVQLAGTAVLLLKRSSSGAEAAGSHLEAYLHRVGRLLAEPKITISKTDLVQLDEQIELVLQILSNAPDTCLVVFLPYKAEMWDCMESVWAACRKDTNCECVVMPIPYLCIDPETGSWVKCYDGDKFPSEVGIVSYQEFLLNRHRPDVAYIHNPFDNHNRVSMVYPSFYSNEIKKYVNKLVYIPYFVTSGFMDGHYLDLPVCKHADYLIYQSAYVKERCRGREYYDKILPLGSPKLDSVIRACSRGGQMPADWLPVLDGKRKLMLNTSITNFLYAGGFMLIKMRQLFDLIRSRKQVILIWRPHPLLEAAIKSMRPNMWEEYSRLKTDFLEARIGIMDQTADISNAVALCDGYIGESATSVINLFAAAGKPIFILNYYINARFSEIEKRRAALSGAVADENCVWFIWETYLARFWIQKGFRQIELVKKIETEKDTFVSYHFLALQGTKIYLSPDRCRYPLEYDIERETFRALTDEFPEREFPLRSRCAAVYLDKVFFLPGDGIEEWNASSCKWKRYYECIKELGGKYPQTFECCTEGVNLWISSSTHNRILQFNMAHGTYKIHSVGSEKAQYSALLAEPEYLWLADRISAAVLRWNRNTGEIRNTSMPAGYRSWKCMSGSNFVHAKLLDMGEWVLTVPAQARGMVKIHKETGAAAVLMPEFWRNAGKWVNGYMPLAHAAAHAVKLSEDTVLVQRMSDKAAARVKFPDETYEVFYPEVSVADFARAMEGRDGFYQAHRETLLMKYESLYDSLEEYLDDFAHNRMADVRERQLRANQTMAVNLDGSCGEKIHAYMMGQI